jgi:hypothetical protein
MELSEGFGTERLPVTDVLETTPFAAALPSESCLHDIVKEKVDTRII